MFLFKGNKKQDDSVISLKIVQPYTQTVNMGGWEENKDIKYTVEAVEIKASDVPKLIATLKDYISNERDQLVIERALKQGVKTNDPKNWTFASLPPIQGIVQDYDTLKKMESNTERLREKVQEAYCKVAGTNYQDKIAYTDKKTPSLQKL